MEDKRDILKDENPFSWQILKNGKDFDIQLYLAKITGNFKHGNEKF
ncbi:MAG: hypothetical protein PF518_13830 [Spirochaetaceae bacterium]|jgi:hypothetical protein|nr:hypothetical protein [Spirochaetaceae bacterium]